ncbi:MAG: dihydroorotate dehydrogenase, partial [Lachnospiraceae bacterium]|nr:dihydroorotate dehydrogenase [Lachnospiraceae bacterium]
MGRLNVTLCGIELDNPIIPASGTYGYGYEFADLYDINLLGTFSFKGTTREPRFGNQTPRIAETPSGMLNAVGLQNPGVEKVISEELPRLKKCFNKPVMANVSGFSVDEYMYVCEKLDAEEQVGWLEVNISCPNVHGGGMSFGTDPKAAAEVTRAVKKVTTKPVIMKLSPNVTSIVDIAKACEDAGADGISLINTMLAMRIDL